MKYKLGLVGVTVAVLLSGCATSAPYEVDFGPKTIKPGSISAGCDAAGKQAVVDNQAIYDQGDDAAYTAALAPTFESCSTASEWIGVAKRYPDFVGYTDGVAVSDNTLQIFCRDFLSSPVCVDAAAQGIQMLPAPPAKG
jgi:hypothetical protein